MTQATLARQVGCATVTIQKIEHDQRRPSRQMAERLAVCLVIDAPERPRFVACALGELAVHHLPLDIQPVSSPASRPPQPLPLQPSFIGRHTELCRLTHLLARPEVRLITLVGLGGIGKTRLALQVASEHLHTYSDGVIFVPLVALQDAQLLEQTIAAALDLGPLSGENRLGQLCLAIRNKTMLLLLDNFEHLVERAAVLAEMLQLAPHVKLLVTSRERLNLAEEWVVDVEGLDVPPEGTPEDELVSYSAVALFVHHARRLRTDMVINDADWLAIAQICRLSQGMPLAIELAAAWVRLLSCTEIVRQIEQGMDFLAVQQRDLAPRHRSLRAVFAHSWQLLTPEEQQTFARLSVFRGSFTREAAMQVTHAPLASLAALIDKSLLQRVGEERFEVHEFARQFAAEKLQAMGETLAVRDRHSEYFIGLAQQALWERTAPPFHPQYVLDRNRQIGK